MLSLSAALIRRLLPQLSEEPPRAEGMRTWIEKGSFFVEASTMPEGMLLKNVTLTEMMPFVSYDFERFALSSLESLLLCAPEADKRPAIGWSATKLYYAAFFGAHAVMRGTGHAVFRVETAQAARISRIASLYDSALQLSTGTYFSRLAQDPQFSINFHMSKLPEIGGAHDQFWKSFYSFLEQITHEVTVKKEPEAAALVGEISDIRDTLSSGGLHGGTWLSAVRNQITYQHKFGVWFPFQKPSEEAVEYINRVCIKDSLSIRRDYNSSRDPLLAFCASCHLITLVSSELTTALCNRLGKSSRLGQLWRRLHRG